jgi:hypothetical protein
MQRTTPAESDDAKTKTKPTRSNITVIAHKTIAVNGDGIFLERGAGLFVGEGDGALDKCAKIIVSK